MCDFRKSGSYRAGEISGGGTIAAYEQHIGRYSLTTEPINGELEKRAIGRSLSVRPDIGDREQASPLFPLLPDDQPSSPEPIEGAPRPPTTNGLSTGLHAHDDAAYRKMGLFRQQGIMGKYRGDAALPV